MSERVVRVNGLEIATEAFGDPAHSPVLLIMGGMAYLNAATNHAALTGVEGWRGRLHEVTAPLLVIHGTADPIYPVEHGVALSEAVAGAKLVRIEGGGHELHRDDWDTTIGAIVAHTSTA